jgi:Cu-Zn family superoxide dismutase
MKNHNKAYTSKHVLAAFLCGALFFSGLAYAIADSGEFSAAQLNFFVQGQDKTPVNGTFDNNGTKVPSSLIYNGTTYIPIRMASNLLDQPVFWEGQSKSVSIGKPYVLLYDGKGTRIGRAFLTQKSDGVALSIQVSGLTPGKHGIHIHEKAIADFDFTTAGGHFNPDQKKHGHLNPDGRHVGDLGNLEVGADGNAETELFIEQANLEKDSKYSVLGRSIIIHAKEDDGKTDPAGDSGDRIAGGNIPQ